MSELKRTALHDLHIELGARMVPFSGYEMPVQYAPGVLKEHLQCRAAAGLFDVGHMGQVILRPRSGDVADAARALESLVPVDVLGLAPGRQRYAMFTDDAGGILDDLMVANRDDHLFLVVNAACKADDLAHLRAHLGDTCAVDEITDRGLLALQGPAAEAVLEGLAPGAAGLRFMDVATLASDFGPLWVSRSGYTGEDGFEISVEAGQAEPLARALLADGAVEPIGLGARDSLRLEAGLCLYGQDIDRSTSPVEAGLSWAIQKVRRTGGARAGGFPGAVRILDELDTGPGRLRVGLRPQTRAPMREGTRLFAAETGGDPVGAVTSGAFGPSVEAPISMGYVPVDLAGEGRNLWGEVRGKRLPVRVAALPFTAAKYKR
ncbi:glycine cleavage system aminomethyltransferase GcvT [Rhodovulum euryhalinum]|uniref:aminomethyltransferase n=1 Tax=Rhodovulum euryhalinum TaxID=35805 RepID=A0A4R2KKS7_9RHOB|nr:glycine cleavage system aminomethyltransferase GcvT [Rhodovulum euryhalinum]TCO71256.1 aminomethyltransferase [Rhodovulum euryhalinum]